MKNASKILFLVGGILAILAIIGYALCFAGSFVCGGLAIAVLEGQSPSQEITDLFGKMVEETHMTLQQISVSFMTMGAVFVVLFVFSIASTVLSFVDRSRENPGLGLLIPSAVIHLCAGNMVSLAGAIVGIVYWSTKGRKEI